MFIIIHEGLVCISLRSICVPLYVRIQMSKNLIIRRYEHVIIAYDLYIMIRVCSLRNNQ